VFYCGLDVAMKSSYVYITDAQGQKKAGGEVATEKAALAERLKFYLRGGLALALEAGNQSAWIHDYLVALGVQVTVVNPAKLKLIAESRQKTDKIDAKILCELLRLGGLPHPVHVPPPETRALRGLLVARRQLVRARVKLANVARGLLRQEGTRLESHALMTFCGWQKLLAGTYTLSHLKPVLEAYFESFKQLTHSIQALDRQLAQRERQDARAARLKTMPKVGRIAALTFLAAVDQVERFPTSRKLVGYSGLAPTVRSSGERTHYGAISRAGRAELRGVWVQIAHLVAADKSAATAPLRKWFSRVAYHRGKKTAIVALARKLLTIAYRILRDETVYDAARLRKKRAA
jgi:transposase